MSNGKRIGAVSRIFFEMPSGFAAIHFRALRAHRELFTMALGRIA